MEAFFISRRNECPLEAVKNTKQIQIEIFFVKKAHTFLIGMLQ
jgi:hypothetical protein